MIEKKNRNYDNLSLKEMKNKTVILYTTWESIYLQKCDGKDLQTSNTVIQQVQKRNLVFGAIREALFPFKILLHQEKNENKQEQLLQKEAKLLLIVRWTNQI